MLLTQVVIHVFHYDFKHHGRNVFENRYPPPSQDQAFASCFPNGGDQTTWSNIPTSTILVCKSKYWQNEKHKGLVKGLILKGALRPGYNCNPNNTILKKYKRKLTGGGYPSVCDPNNPYCYNECSDVTCCYVCIDFEFYVSVTQSSNLLII